MAYVSTTHKLPWIYMVGLVEVASTFDLSRRLTTGKLVGAQGYTAGKRDGGPFGQISRSTWLTGQAWRLTIAFSSFAFVSFVRGSSFTRSRAAGGTDSIARRSIGRQRHHCPFWARLGRDPALTHGSAAGRQSCTRLAKC